MSHRHLVWEWYLKIQFIFVRASSGVNNLLLFIAVWCTTIWVFVLYQRDHIRSFPETCLMIPSSANWSKKIVLRWLVRMDDFDFVLFVDGCVSSSLSSLSWTILFVFLNIIDSSSIRSLRLMIFTHGNVRHFGVYAYIFMYIFKKLNIIINIIVFVVVYVFLNMKYFDLW